MGSGKKNKNASMNDQKRYVSDFDTTYSMMPHSA